MKACNSKGGIHRTNHHVYHCLQGCTSFSPCAQCDLHSLMSAKLVAREWPLPSSFLAQGYHRLLQCAPSWRGLHIAGRDKCIRRQGHRKEDSRGLHHDEHSMHQERVACNFESRIRRQNCIWLCHHCKQTYDILACSNTSNLAATLSDARQTTKIRASAEAYVQSLKDLLSPYLPVRTFRKWS